MQLVLILFSSLFWFHELHLELSVQNSIEGGIPSESHYKSLNYREGNNNSPIQVYVHLDDYTQPTYEMAPGFKPFTQKTHRRKCEGVRTSDFDQRLIE